MKMVSVKMLCLFAVLSIQTIHGNTSGSMPDVIVVGSLNTDFVTYTERFPAIGETLFGELFQTNFGGKGANQAVQTAKLGVNTAFIGCLGDDLFGQTYREHLRAEKVADEWVRTVEGEGSGTASIVVDFQGQNSIIVVPGANAHVCEKDVDGASEIVQSAKLLLCQNEIPVSATAAALRLARKHNVISLFNPAPASPEALDLAKLCDIVCVNEVELAALSGVQPSPSEGEKQTEAEFERAIVAMMKKLGNDCKLAVVTLGEGGACTWAKSDKKCRFYAAPKIEEVVDTVGAGDSFIGAFASSLVRGASIDQAVQCALYCASDSVTRPGAQGSYPSIGDLASAASSGTSETGSGADLSYLTLFSQTPSSSTSPPSSSSSSSSSSAAVGETDQQRSVRTVAEMRAQLNL